MPKISSKCEEYDSLFFILCSVLYDSFNKTTKQIKSQEMPQQSLSDSFPLWSAWRKDGDLGLARTHTSSGKASAISKDLWLADRKQAFLQRSHAVDLFSFQPPVFTDSKGIKSRSAYDFLSLIPCWCHPEALSLRLGTSGLPPVPLWTV